MSSSATMGTSTTSMTTMQVQGKSDARTSAAFGALRSPRAQWIEAFSSTLLALSPRWGLVRTRRMACDLWDDLGHFDPVLAAEMEYESSLCDA
jgi:hypothetical protein